MKISLKKPLKHKGQDLTELDINLEDLTGFDLLEVEQQVNNSGDNRAIFIPEYSKTYLIVVAARALHMPIEVLKQLGARDFTGVTRAVQNFLLESDYTNQSNGEEAGIVQPKS